MNDDKLLDDEIFDIALGPDSTRLGEITNVEGGKVDAVETDEKTSEEGVITEVEPRVESGKVGSKLRLIEYLHLRNLHRHLAKTKKSSAYGRNSGS